MSQWNRAWGREPRGYDFARGIVRGLRSMLRDGGEDITLAMRGSGIRISAYGGHRIVPLKFLDLSDTDRKAITRRVIDTVTDVLNELKALDDERRAE